MEGGAIPKKVLRGGTLYSQENLSLLEQMFPDIEANVLSIYLSDYPGEYIEGLIERLIGRNTRTICTICWEPLDVGEIVTCDLGNHIYCIECASQGLEQQRKNGKEVPECFSPDCTSRFDMRVLEMLLDPKEVTKYVQKLCIAEIDKCSDMGMDYCPQCNYGISIDPDTNMEVFVCEYKYCRAMSCRKCKKPAHPRGKTCAVDETLKTQHEAEKILTEAVIRTCHSCNTPYQKLDGCNRIQCKCGAQMCYVCKKTIKHGYDHFYNTNEIPYRGQCPLQANPEDLHNMERAAAAKRAVAFLDPSNKLDLSSNPILKK